MGISPKLLIGDCNHLYYLVCHFNVRKHCNFHENRFSRFLDMACYVPSLSSVQVKLVYLSIFYQIAF